MQLQLLQPLHDGRPLLPPLLVTTSPPSIPARPALAPWCRVVEDDARVLVEHGGTLVTLEGRAAGSLLPALLPLLDGTRTVDDVGAAVGERARPAVDRALELLAHHRLLVDGPIADDGDADASSAASYAASVTRRISPAGAVAALAGASVAVVGSGRQADEVARQLRLAGIGQVERPPGTTVGSASPRRRGTPARRHGAAAGGQPCLPRGGPGVAPAAPVRRPPDRRRAALPPRLLGVRDVLRAAPSRVLRIRGRRRAPRAAAPARQGTDAAPRRRRGPRRDRRGPLADRGRPLAPRPPPRRRGRTPAGRLVAPRPACSALPRLRSVRAGSAGAVVRGDRVSATAVAGFTPLDEALRRLEGACSPVTGIVTARRPDDARRRPRVDPEPRLPARVRAAHARRSDGRLRERGGREPRAGARRRAGRSGRALLRDVPPDVAAAPDHGPRARRPGRAAGALRALPCGAARTSVLPLRVVHRGHRARLRRGSLARGLRTGVCAGGARLPAAASVDRPADRVPDEQRPRLRTDGSGGGARRVARARGAGRGDARMEREALPPTDRVGVGSDRLHAGRPVLRPHWSAVRRGQRQHVPRRPCRDRGRARRPGSGAALAVGAGCAADPRDAWLKALSESFGVHRWLGSVTAGAVDRPPPPPEQVQTFDDHMLFYARDEEARLAGFLDASPETCALDDLPRLEGSTPEALLHELVARLARTRHRRLRVRRHVTGRALASGSASCARWPRSCASWTSRTPRASSGASGSTRRPATPASRRDVSDSPTSTRILIRSRDRPGRTTRASRDPTGRGRADGANDAPPRARPSLEPGSDRGLPRGVARPSGDRRSARRRCRTARAERRDAHQRRAVGQAASGTAVPAAPRAAARERRPGGVPRAPSVAPRLRRPRAPARRARDRSSMPPTASREPSPARSRRSARSRRAARSIRSSCTSPAAASTRPNGRSTTTTRSDTGWSASARSRPTRSRS